MADSISSPIATSRPLQRSTRLEDLVVVDTPVTDAGLAQLEGLTDLTRLILINVDQRGSEATRFRAWSIIESITRAMSSRRSAYFASSNAPPS